MSLTRPMGSWLHLFMENNDLNDIDDFDSGIELDKIEVPKVAARPVAQKSAEAPASEEPGKTEFELESEVDPQKRLKFIMVIVVFIFVGAAVVLVSQQEKLRAWFLGQGPKSDGSAVEYQAIAPIITNLGTDKHIKIALMIKNSAELKKQILVTESIVRDKVLMFLTSQNTKRVINESDLDKVKSYINDELTHMLQSDYQDEIVLKELMVY